MKVRNLFTNMRIQTKLTLVFLLTIAAPLLFFGTFLLNTQIDLLESVASNSAQRELIQMADRMSLQLTQIKAITNLLYLDEDLNALLSGYSAENPKLDKRTIHSVVSRYNAGLNNLYFNVAIIMPDHKLYGNALHSASISSLDITDTNWYKFINGRMSNTIWTTDEKLDTVFSTPSLPYIYAIRQIYDRHSWKPIGIMIIGFSETEIKKMYSGYVSSYQSAYILEESGQIISSEDNQNLHFPIDISMLNNYSGSYMQSISSTRQLVTYHTINATQWKIVTISDLDILLDEFSSAKNIFITILCLYLIAATILSFILPKKFLVPLKQLYHNMALVKEGDLNARVEIRANDEIGELSVQFNDMLITISNLVQNVINEQQLKREAEILALQTQINPHFLYNTLASIRFMVYSGKKEDADTVILALIRIMKNTLSDVSEFITVDKELSLLSDYIQIQQMTFARPIDVTISVSDDIKNCKTAKLLLQPIVENAILHGLKPKQEDCKLQIEGKLLDENAIIFTVTDNGIGFESSRAYTSENEFQPKSGVGLKNVNDRIALTFGSKYGLKIRSTPGSGTAVYITIPKIVSSGGYISYEHSDC